MLAIERLAIELNNEKILAVRKKVVEANKLLKKMKTEYSRERQDAPISGLKVNKTKSCLNSLPYSLARRDRVRF